MPTQARTHARTLAALDPVTRVDTEVLVADILEVFLGSCLGMLLYYENKNSKVWQRDS